MKVAFVGDSKLDSFRGIGTNIKELLTALKKSKGIEIVDDRGQADVVHFTKFNPFFISLPFFKSKNQKWILTIHDLIQLVYPKHYPPGVKGSVRFLINKFLVWKNVDKIITISETSKKDICKFLNQPSEMVEVIYLAPKTVVKKLKPGKWTEEIKKKFKLPEKFVLFDHGVNYNKNVPTLIRACKKVGACLVIVGKETENIGKLDLNHPELMHLKGVDFSSVLKLGYVTDNELNMLFNLATVYCQPSYYEGFGMPVLEAMKAGCPVIASTTQALKEVGEEACLYFNPYDENELAEKIKLMLSDKLVRERYIKLGTIQVSKFSWDRSAEQTLNVYKNL